MSSKCNLQLCELYHIQRLQKTVKQWVRRYRCWRKIAARIIQLPRMAVDNMSACPQLSGPEKQEQADKATDTSQTSETNKITWWEFWQKYNVCWVAQLQLNNILSQVLCTPSSWCCSIISVVIKSWWWLLLTKGVVLGSLVSLSLVSLCLVTTNLAFPIINIPNNMPMKSNQNIVSSIALSLAAQAHVFKFNDWLMINESSSETDYHNIMSWWWSSSLW